MKHKNQQHSHAKQRNQPVLFAARIKRTVFMFPDISESSSIQAREHIVALFVAVKLEFNFLACRRNMVLCRVDNSSFDEVFFKVAQPPSISQFVVLLLSWLVMTPVKVGF